MTSASRNNGDRIGIGAARSVLRNPTKNTRKNYREGRRRSTSPSPPSTNAYAGNNFTITVHMEVTLKQSEGHTVYVGSGEFNLREKQPTLVQRVLPDPEEEVPTGEDSDSELLREVLDLLLHASQCRFRFCRHPRCRKMKELFRHGEKCEVRAVGGCVSCNKMWHLLRIHAKACKVSECRVPRCSDIKEHLRRLQHVW